MLTLLRPAAVLLTCATLLTGLLYPLAVTGLAQAVFPAEANGSLIVAAPGRVEASALIGRPSERDRDFWSRPSATSPHPYNGAASSGSNLGPSNPALVEAVRGRVEALRAAHPERAGVPIPVDLVTTSGSGLDPHISPAAAHFQTARVARARGLSEETVRGLVDAHTEGRMLGLFGAPRVHVLRLNRALDALPPGGA
jgi:K+-transporting ATPase ATPase C chain